MSAKDKPGEINLDPDTIPANHIPLPREIEQPELLAPKFFQSWLEKSGITLPTTPGIPSESRHQGDYPHERDGRLYYEVTKGIPYRTIREAYNEGLVFVSDRDNLFYPKPGFEYCVEDKQERERSGNYATKPIDDKEPSPKSDKTTPVKPALAQEPPPKPESTPTKPPSKTQEKEPAPKPAEPEMPAAKPSPVQESTDPSRRTLLKRIGTLLAAAVGLQFGIISPRREKQKEITAISSSMQKIADFITSLKPGLLDEKISPYHNTVLEDKHSGLTLTVSFFEGDRVRYQLTSSISNNFNSQNESITVVIAPDEILVTESVTCHLTSNCREDQPDPAEDSANPTTISRQYSISVSDFEDSSEKNWTLLKNLK